MKIDTVLLNSVTELAKASPRLRMNYDLRTCATCPEAGLPRDNSQRMLNAMEPGTVLPIHRHTKTTEVVVVLRGKLRQNFYDAGGKLEESFISEAGGPNAGYVVEVGRWHNTESLESGTVILECKNGVYEPLSEDDILTPESYV